MDAQTCPGARCDFDHAVVVVMDRMDDARAYYERLGFTLTPRGHHTLGSINHLATFAGTYLELLGYAPGEREKRAEVWVHTAGLTGLAFRANDAATLHGEMVGNGVAVEALKSFSRPVPVGGGTKDASFRTFQLAASRVPDGRVFFCEHRTPELIWQPGMMRHRNGALEIEEHLMVATDMERARDLVSCVVDLSGCKPDPDAVCFLAGSTRVRIMSEAAALARFGPEVPRPRNGYLRMSGIGLKTASLKQTRAALEAGGIPAREFEGGLLVVSNDIPSPLLWFKEQSP